MEIGVRLREERSRLGYSQADICNSCGISKRSYIHYESGDRSPDAEFLGAASKIGMDVQYVVTGIRSENSSCDFIRTLLTKVVLLSEAERNVVFGLVNGLLELRQERKEV